VAHYTSALLAALAAEFPDDEWRVVLPRGPVERLPDGVVPVRTALPGRVVFGAAAALGRPRLDRLAGGCDVAWAPAPAPLAVSDGIPLVLTVHDRSWEERPGDFTPYERLWHTLARPRRLAARAARVITPTETGRADVVAAWGLDPAHVHAIPEAPAVTAPGALRSSAPHFLFVGALEPRKAPGVLSEGFRRARARGLEAELVVVGDGRLAATVHGPGVRVIARVPDDALPELYAGALAVVLPSWLEGFGLPPVEGLAHGTPAIVSDLPVLREVLGDGARYFAPGDGDGLADALLALAADPAERARLAAAGRDRIAPLSWSATARATRAVLAEAAG